MRLRQNERGSVLVFVTLMMVLLFVIVGMGLDTGHLSYIRSHGQPAVDAAALAAVQALPTFDINEVNKRAAELNYNGTVGNNYLDSSTNKIGANNVTLINYDQSTSPPTITKAASITTANGVRVALESTNPYDAGAAATPMKSPLFLTPLLNLMGQSTKGTQDVSVSAVAVLRAIPGMPIAISGWTQGVSDCRHASHFCTGGSGTDIDPYRNCRLLQVSSKNSNGKIQDDPDYQDSGWTTFGVPSANAPAIKALVGNNSTCGNIPPLEIDSGCIYLNNGQITPVLTEFNNVYGNNNNGFAGPWDGTNPVYDGDWGIIPVVRRNLGNFNGCEPVKSWAKLGIRGVMKSGNQKWIIGDLVCNWSLDQVGATGCYTTQLVRDTKSGM